MLFFEHCKYKELKYDIMLATKKKLKFFSPLPFPKTYHIEKQKKC